MHESLIVEALVLQALPKAMFRLVVEESRAVIVAGVGAECRRVNAKILPGDRVTVQLSPYDPNRGRIMSRL